MRVSHMRTSPAARAVIVLLALLAAGCGGKKAYPVTGTVVFEDDRPAVELAGGSVSLESVADNSNAAGEIQRDGTFHIQNPLGADGVPAGKYRVLVLSPPELRSRPVIDRKYARYETSGLTITVKEEPNQVPIKVHRLKRS